jgi:hypothetical protein
LHCDDPTAAAAVSPSPGDTVSAPCRRSKPGPAALNRLRQWWGPAPARPKPVWSTRRVEHGGQRREAAMGKGLPGGRRQAGSIDYRTEPRRSVLPDRPRRAIHVGCMQSAERRVMRRVACHGQTTLVHSFFSYTVHEACSSARPFARRHRLCATSRDRFPSKAVVPVCPPPPSCAAAR